MVDPLAAEVAVTPSRFHPVPTKPVFGPAGVEPIVPIQFVLPAPPPSQGISPPPLIPSDPDADKIKPRQPNDAADESEHDDPQAIAPDRPEDGSDTTDEDPDNVPSESGDEPDALGFPEDTPAASNQPSSPPSVQRASSTAEFQSGREKAGSDRTVPSSPGTSDRWRPRSKSRAAAGK
jgi:hypothetical protein